MPLEPGARLGGYEVLTLLGVGGMGEVYRARDPKLQRDVAIKSLPAQFAHDPERIARFEREAQALAALNHAGIAGIHELLDHEGARYLVLEYVPGESLDAHIRRGALPLDEALPLAGQVAEALEAAHDKGIVHRDLKPANIAVTPDGRAKILDFGLAKALDPAATTSTPAMSQSPTMVTMTAGVIIGTAAYMSPEQARGKPVDRRADIWAFGCVLYEMVTGTPAFDGETVSDTIGAIMRADPDWSRLPPDTPANVRALLQRCLRKDARARLPHIGVARLELSEPAAHTGEPTRVARASIVPWGMAAVLAIALAAIGASVWLRQPERSLGLVRFEIRPADDTWTFGHTVPQRGSAPPAPHFAVSPDGRTLAYVLSQAGSTNLWVRPFSSAEARMLPRTEDASFPFWSPDGREVGFFTASTLKKVSIADGAVLTLCPAENPEGGTWLDDGTILFASFRGVIWRVSARGGAPAQVTSPGAGLQHLWPQALRGRNEFLYIERVQATAPRIAARWHSLDSNEEAEILQTQGRVMYAGGQLFYPQGGQLLMQPFDVVSRQLQSTPRIVVPDLAINLNGRAGYFVTDAGVLAYRQSTASSLNSLVWRTRNSAEAVEIDRGKIFARAALSPDGTRAVVQISSAGTAGGQFADLWMYDLVRNVPTRFTSEPGFEAFPVWSPDGKLVAYSSATAAVTGDATVWVKLASGGEPARQISKRVGTPRAFTPDGKSMIMILRTDAGPSASMQPLDGSEPTTLMTNALDLAISPDGAWIAYSSADALINDIYLQAFPPRGEKWRVSVSGGVDPHWSHDGRELFFVATGNLMVVPFDGKPAGLPRPTVLFSQVLPGPAFVIGTGTPRFGVAPDRKRFLMIAPPAAARDSSPLTVIVNWPELLKEP